MCSLSSGTLGLRPGTLEPHISRQASMHCSRTCCKSTVIWTIMHRCVRDIVVQLRRESNSRRMAASDKKKYQQDAPRHVRETSSISFFSPIYCPSHEIADQLEIGRKPRLACAVCLKEQSPDVRLFFCSGCSGEYDDARPMASVYR